MRTYKYVQLIAALLPVVTTSANLKKTNYSVQLTARSLFVEIQCVIYPKTLSPVQVIVVPEHVEIESAKLMSILDSVRKIALPIPSAVMAFAIPTKTQKSVLLIARSSLVVMAFASWMNRSVSALLIASPLLTVAEIV